MSGYGSYCFYNSECASGCCSTNDVCNFAGSSNCYGYINPDNVVAAVWWIIVIYCVIGVLICAGCIAVIVCIVRSCNRQSEMNAAAMLAMSSQQQNQVLFVPGG